MRRNFEVFKKMLIAVNQSDGPLRKLEGVTYEQFCFHANLMDDAGLIKIADFGIPGSSIIRLTYKGHDALEALISVDSINWNNLVGCNCK